MLVSVKIKRIYRLHPFNLPLSCLSACSMKMIHILHYNLEQSGGREDREH